MVDMVRTYLIMQNKSNPKFEELAKETEFEPIKYLISALEHPINRN